MKTKLYLILILIGLVIGINAQTYNTNGNWMYSPTGTIKTLTSTAEGFTALIDGDDDVLTFKHVGNDKYKCLDKEGLYVQFKSDDLHLIYNVDSEMQNTWTRYNKGVVVNPDPIDPVKTDPNKPDPFGDIGIKEARPFKSAIGARFGIPLSVSYKSFLNQSNAFELYAGYRSFGLGNNITFGAAYQLHRGFKSLNNFQWYFGVGVTGNRWGYDSVLGSDAYSNYSVAPTGFLGWSYTFKKAPINISADWQPTFYIGSSGYYSGFGAGYGSFAVRYILGK